VSRNRAEDAGGGREASQKSWWNTKSKNNCDTTMAVLRWCCGIFFSEGTKENKYIAFQDDTFETRFSFDVRISKVVRFFF
jgi:hypothetical protein